LQYSTVRRISSMSEKSIIGSTPWEKRFIPSVTRSTLPVRSPLPKSVPSTRSAPAITPNSAAATAVPRSLCGCRDSTTACRRGRCRDIHSIESAYTFGVAISTVAGRLMIAGQSGVGCQTSMTAEQTSSA
jgi:hypothetical protein